MHNISKGKIGESFAISKFLEQSFEVFSSVADIDYTDLVVSPPKRPNSKNTMPLLRIQVKSVTSQKGAYRIKKNPNMKPDYYFLINTENDDFWIVPDEVIRTQIKKQKQSKKIKDAMLKIPEGWQKYKGFEELKKKYNYDPSPKFRSQHQGKVGEKLAIAYFLGKRYHVYDGVADERGIDLVIRKKNYYRDVQVKYATKSYSYRNISNIKRENYYYLFINGYPREYFFIPSSEVIKIRTESGGLYLNEELRRKYQRPNRNISGHLN